MGKRKDYIEEFCKDNNIQSGDIIQSSFEDIKMCRLYANHKTLRPTELGVEGVWFGTNHARGVLYNLMTGKYDYKIIRKGSKKNIKVYAVRDRDTGEIVSLNNSGIKYHCQRHQAERKIQGREDWFELVEFELVETRDEQTRRDTGNE